MKPLYKEFLSKINLIKPDVLQVRIVNSPDSLNLGQRGTYVDKVGIADGFIGGSGSLRGIEVTLDQESSIDLNNLIDKFLLENTQIQILLMNRLVKLEALPQNIRYLKKLHHLELENCNIRELPDFISELPLEYLDLRGNNRLRIPFEILEHYGNPKAILSYYFVGIKRNRKAILETKLLIVGQGSVGKTSLVRRILYNDFDL